jgi:tape measure domain-containing protein
VATETLEWVYSLYDKVSGPAGRIQKSLQGIGSTLGGLPANIALVQQGLDMLLSGAAQLGRAIVDASQFAVNALAFKESTLASFELMLGTKKAAQDFFDQAKGFGKLTPFETEDVVKSFQNLLQAGFTQQEVPIVFQALGDVAAGKGFDKQVIDRLTLAFGQIRSKGKLMGDDLRQVVEAGVGRGVIFENIAKQLGIDPKSVDAVMSKGQVSADVAITAMLDSIREKFSGGKELGAGMLAQATTIRGLFSTLASAPMDMFLDIDLENSPGFKGLKSFLQNLVEALNPDGAAGSRLKGLIEAVVNDVGGMLGRIDMNALIAGFDTFVSIAQTAIEGAKVFGASVMDVIGPTLELFGTYEGGRDASNGFVESMRLLGHLLGGVLNVMLLVGGAATWAMEGFSALSKVDFGYLGDQLKELGLDIVQGFVDGLKAATGLITNPVGTLATLVTDTMKGALGIQSPSRVFMELGAQTAEGYRLGLSGEGAAVDSAVQAMADATPSGGGRGPVSVALTINVDGAGKNAEEVARHLADMLPSELAALFESMAIEGGTA